MIDPIRYQSDIDFVSFPKEEIMTITLFLKSYAIAWRIAKPFLGLVLAPLREVTIIDKSNISWVL